jgi:hypothetical protein
MRAAFLIPCALVTAGLAGCASITAGTTQPVSVTAVCDGAIVPGTSCTLLNDKGRWEIITPQAVVVQKSYGDLAVTCRKGESSGMASFVSKPNGGVWGNVIAGGLIGYAVDSANGAGFNYPTETAVVLSSPCPNP